jgi:site-specific DNA-methyltransferase (adenine-specific)
MRAYYERAGIAVICADYREVLPELAAGTFDVAYADPPYGQTSLAWDHWPEGWVAEVARVLKTPGALWCWGSLRMFMDHAEEFRCLKMAQDIVWEKNNGSGFATDRFRRIHEQAVQFYQGKWDALYRDVPTTPYEGAVRKSALRRAGRGAHLGATNKDSLWKRERGDPVLSSSIIYSRSCRGFAENETQKPLLVCEPLHHFSAKKNTAHVLSIFGGSGTDAELMFNRGCTGVVIEMREQQCEVIARRLSQMLPLGTAA